MKCFVYRHYDENETLLYVGIANDVIHRTLSHRRNSDWFSRVRNIKMQEYPNRLLASEAEASAIKEESPLFNIRHVEHTTEHHAEIIESRAILSYHEITAVVALHKYRNFGRAADSLGISQPAISAKLQKIKDKLGYSIIEGRSHTATVFTPRGENLVIECEKLLKATKSFNINLASHTSRRYLA